MDRGSELGRAEASAASAATGIAAEHCAAARRCVSGGNYQVPGWLYMRSSKSKEKLFSQGAKRSSLRRVLTCQTRLTCWHDSRGEHGRNHFPKTVCGHQAFSAASRTRRGRALPQTPKALARRAVLLARPRRRLARSRRFAEPLAPGAAALETVVAPAAAGAPAAAQGGAGAETLPAAPVAAYHTTSRILASRKAGPCGPLSWCRAQSHGGHSTGTPGLHDSSCGSSRLPGSRGRRMRGCRRRGRASEAQ